jgi:hypothetical protein
MTLAWDKEPVLEAWMTNWIHVLPVAGVLGRDVPGPRQVPSCRTRDLESKLINPLLLPIFPTRARLLRSSFLSGD